MGKANRKNDPARERGAPTRRDATRGRNDVASPLMILGLLSLLAVAIYSNAFSSSFHFDDTTSIIENVKVKDLKYFFDLSDARYVGNLSFALNYRVGGFNVFGYHLVNVLIHITNGFLVYRLVLLLFRTPRLSGGIRNQGLDSPAGRHPLSLDLHAPAGIALFASLLFLVHPIQTQAVTYIAQRFTSLATVFYLLAVIGYLGWRLADDPASQHGRARHLWYAGAFFSAVLAMKTKEISLTLPLMLVLVEAVCFQSSSWKRWIAILPFLLTPLLSLSPRMGELHAVAHEVAGGQPAQAAPEPVAMSQWAPVVTQFRVVMTYLRLLVFPVDQNLDYDYPIYDSLRQPAVYGSLLFLAGLVAFAVYLLSYSKRTSDAARSRLLAFGILWFFIALSVEFAFSLYPLRDAIVEHRLYLPAVGFCVAAASAGSWAYQRMPRRWHRTALVLAALLVILLSAASHLRNEVWKDNISLWTDVVRKSPHKARPHDILGQAYVRSGRADEGMQEFQTALTLDPRYAQAHNNLGAAYLQQGRSDEAIREFQSALTLDPQYAQARNNLGVSYMRRGELDRAIQEFQRAIAINPDYAVAHTNLGDVYRQQGKTAEAALEYESGVKFSTRRDSPTFSK